MDESSKQMGDDLVLALLKRLRPDAVMVASSWHRYRHIPALELREVVALSVNLDPIFANLPSIIFALRDDNPLRLAIDLEAVLIRFVERHIIATSNLEPAGSLPVYERHDSPGHCKVRLADFAIFADGMGWDLPEEFPLDAATNPYQSARRASETSAHDTELLRALNDASREFWSTYDPEQTSTAPLNEDVADWLVQKRNVAKRVAEVMAQMLRANGLPPGRRK